MQQADLRHGTPCAAQAASRARPGAVSAADGDLKTQRPLMVHDAGVQYETQGPVTQAPTLLGVQPAWRGKAPHSS